MSVPIPNYTQIPNSLLEQLAKMPESAVRVALAVARKTFGYHKTRDLLSLSQIMELTKLSRQGVLNGIEYLEANNWVIRTPAGQSFVYQLLVNEVDQSTNLTSQPSRPEVVNEVDRKAEKLVNEVDTQKKEEKERKEKRGIRRGAKKPPAEKTPRPRDVFFDCLAEITHSNPALLGGVIAGTKKKLAAIGATVDDLRCFADWWNREDFRGKKGDPPKPPQIISEWGRFEVWRKGTTAKQTAVQTIENMMTLPNGKLVPYAD